MLFVRIPQTWVFKPHGGYLVLFNLLFVSARLGKGTYQFLLGLFDSYTVPIEPVAVINAAVDYERPLSLSLNSLVVGADVLGWKTRNWVGEEPASGMWVVSPVSGWALPLPSWVRRWAEGPVHFSQSIFFLEK